MTERLRDFFSPDRLRRKWSEEEPAAAPEAPPSAPGEEALAVAALLETIAAQVRTRFADDESAPLRALVQELGRMVAEGDAGAEAVELLRRVEDLAECAVLRGRRR